MKPGAVLFFPLFDRENSSPKVSELGEFFLDFLQSFKSLAVSDLSLGSISICASILLVRLLNLSDLCPEAPDFFPQNFEVIHVTRITHRGSFRVGWPVERAVSCQLSALSSQLS